MIEKYDYKFDARKQKVWFTSDWHHGHAYFADDIKGEKITPIWKERGYSSCEEMNYDIIKQTNNLVGTEDILIHHGDVALRTTPEQVKSLFERINCQNILLAWGNHESSTVRIYQEELSKLNLPPEIKHVYPLKYKNLTFCGPEIIISIRWGNNKKDNLIFHCSHFPKSIWDKMKHGNFVSTVGHSHHGFYDTLPTTLDRGKILDVGWDYLKRPLNFWEVKEIMDKKKVIKKDKNH